MKVIRHDEGVPEGPLKDFKDSYHFQLTRKIAEGGMGIVYEARLFGAEDFEKQVAIKTIREEISNNQEFVKLFIGEAKLAACLVHQNIVQIYRLGRVGKTYYVAMEYVHGVDLKDFLWRHFEKGQRTPVEIAAFIASRVCRGLEYAHTKCDAKGNPLHVVHCDVSPRNLMISAEGEVKITDFGIARARGLIESEKVEGLGKAAYVAPEQIRGETVDGRADLFALGTVLFELLTGERAFRGKSRQEILESVTKQPVLSVRTLNPEVPPELEKILLKALKPALKDRYADAGAMGYDLEYHLYHKGYGPTIQTLEKYLRETFPELYVNSGKPRAPRFVQPDLSADDLSLSLSLIKPSPRP